MSHAQGITSLQGGRDEPATSHNTTADTGVNGLIQRTNPLIDSRSSASVCAHVEIVHENSDYGYRWHGRLARREARGRRQ